MLYVAVWLCWCVLHAVSWCVCTLARGTMLKSGQCQCPLAKTSRYSHVICLHRFTVTCPVAHSLFLLYSYSHCLAECYGNEDHCYHIYFCDLGKSLPFMCILIYYICVSSWPENQQKLVNSSATGFLCRCTMSMEQAANTAIAAAVDQYFPLSTENISVPVCLRTLGYGPMTV